MTNSTNRNSMKTILNHFNLEANDSAVELYLQTLDAIYSDDNPDVNVETAVSEGFDRNALERYIEQDGDNAE